MKVFQNITSGLAVTFFLSACMGGGGGGVETAQAIPPDATPQENGLPYGADAWAFADSEDVEIAAVGGRVSDQSGSATELMTITFASGFFSDAPTERAAVLTLFGEEVTITNGEGQLANGQTVRLNFDPTLAGDHSGIVQAYSYAALQNPMPVDPINGEAHYVFGFLTNPAVINGRVSGSVTYSGDLTAAGLVRVNDDPLGDLGGVELDGAVSLNTNFGTDRVSGAFSGTYEAGGQTVNVALSLPNTAFAGNTFAGNFGCGGNCSSNTHMDAAFYGPNGDEIAGVLSVDTSNVIDGDDYAFEGVGSFVIVVE